jgi:predicted enzyme related to lactoylglutathione lyase
MKNSVQWFEIATTDLERAKKFYSYLFKLEFEFIDMGDSKMYMFGDPQGMGSAGSLIQSSDSRPGTNGSVVYFTCDDVANEINLVEKAGGKVLVPKTDIGDFGFFAQIIDTEGNRVGLHSDR